MKCSQEHMRHLQVMLRRSPRDLPDAFVASRALPRSLGTVLLAFNAMLCIEMSRSEHIEQNLARDIVSANVPRKVNESND